MVKQTIKIFCRVKPTKGKTGLYEIDEDESGGPKLSFYVPKDQSQIVNNTKEEYNFRFQRVFEQQTKQEEVFEHVAQPVVDNAISGYNGTIFAYGQTGSGKTFTVTGGAERFADRGIIPRTLSYLFEYYEKHPEFTYTTHVSYLEIYNESGYDLLDPKHEAAKLEDLPKVSLMEDTDQNIHLKNLSVHQAMNEEEALNLLFLGDTNRMIAETPMNQASTRSHCIFTIHLTAREPGSATIRRSKLHLVDLAGSERVGKTGVGGTLLAEAKYINLSLHYLEQVIVALSEKSRSHIPYRNSMMTSVLRDSLGGNCMTTMIATCSVEKKNIDESISTCRFAQRVALIKNDALLNEEVDPKLMVLRLKKEIVELKDQLSLATGEQPTDDLSEEDMDRLHQMVRGYVEDTDPDATLPVGADMRKINECFRIFKRMVLERHPGKVGVANGAVEEEEEPSVSEDSGLGSAPSTAGSAEVKKLKDLLQQRDNEINILVNMLKKEKKRAQDAALLLEERGIPFHTGEGTQPNGPGRPPSSRNKNRNREERSRESVNISRSLGHSESREKETTPPYSQSTTVRLRKIGGEMSVGRQEAFEIFKRDYEHSVTIDDQKSLLKQRYSEAKQLGEKVNSSRAQINHVKGLIQQHRMARAAQGISENVGFSEEPDEEEQHLRQQMEDEKDSYKVTYNRLRVLKTEIEHLQHLLEKARLQMQKDFELWWAEQTVNAHAPKPPQEPPAAWKTPPISPINPPQHPPSRKMAANFSINPTQEPGPSHVHQGGSSRRSRHGSFTDNPTADGEPIRASHSYHGNLDAVGLGHHGDRRLSSHSDSGSSHGRVPRHREVLEDSRSAAPAIPLTGDARADADIMAFFKARQKILQQQGKR